MENYQIRNYSLESLFINQGKENLGSPSGLKIIDDSIEFYGLCGLTGVPGKGKTSLAIQIMVHNAFVLQKPVIYVSLEVSVNMAISKIVSYLIGVPIKDILKGNMTYVETQKYIKALVDIKKCENLLIIDSKKASLKVIEDTINTSRQSHFKETGDYSTPLVVLDYLNIFYDYGDVSNSSSSGEKTGNQMKELIRIKNETSANFIVIVAKNKQGYKQAEMSSLKGSNDLEYGFETIVSLEEVHEDFPISNYPEYGDFKEVNVLVTMMKNRWGNASANLPLYFDGKRTRFFEPK
jgi:replicative DNA helicase